jgi:hypothetical protein
MCVCMYVRTLVYTDAPRLTLREFLFFSKTVLSMKLRNLKFRQSGEWLYVCIYLYMYVCISICMHLGMCLYLFIMYLYVFVCMLCKPMYVCVCFTMRIKPTRAYENM